MSVTIYHNPDCGTSRNALAMIRATGIEPIVIEYLKAPPSRARLVELIAAMGITPRALLREKGTPYAELGLGGAEWSDDALVDFMLAHPILINRPIVVTPKGVRLCRPSELVLDLLDAPLAEDFAKEDGERVAMADPAVFRIREGDLSDRQVRDLLALHLAGMHANSPPGSVFALDLSGLRQPDVRVWTAWEGERLAGIAALRRLPDGIGEVKSMRTHPGFLNRGVASRLLAFIIAKAAAAGMTGLCLETGRGQAFEPALALYRRHGFTNGPAFGDYEENAFSQFLHLRFGQPR